MNQHYSQLGQDLFALDVAVSKSYIEIGAWKPVKYSNSYLLELNQWKGFSLELNTVRKESWDNQPDRKNKIYWKNAIDFDYITAIKENNLSNRIGYLSCDIEPPNNTFLALQRVIDQGIVFDCITFEHDRYNSDINIDPMVTDYLKSKGYKIAVKDVYRIRKMIVPNQKKKDIKICHMETWYVHEDIEYKEISYDEWIQEKK